MVIREFVVKDNKPIPVLHIDNTEWIQGWHGYYKMRRISQFEDNISEYDRKIEIDCFLSILKEIDKDNVTLLELGAGWGEWCLALAGVVNFGLVPHRVRKFNYLAVEGEPYYCELINKHFEFNMLPMNVLNCAVSDKDGYCYFDKFSGEQNHFDTWCTQGMTFRGNISGSKLKTLLMAGYRLLRRELVKVPMYKLDTILDKYEIYPDIIQMDIVGMEAKVIKSTKYFPMYWIIGTHHRNINRDIWQFLNLRYECLLNIEPPIKKTNGLAQDGLQVFKKR